MNKAKKIELLMPIFFILLGVATIIGSISLPGDEDIFPRMVGIFMTIVSAFIFVSTLKSKTCKNPFEGLRLGRVLKTLLSLAIYTVILPYLGFVFSSVILSLFTMISLEYRDYKRAVLYSLISSVAIFVLFKVFFKVSLPLLILDF